MNSPIILLLAVVCLSWVVPIHASLFDGFGDGFWPNLLAASVQQSKQPSNDNNNNTSSRWSFSRSVSYSSGNLPKPLEPLVQQQQQTNDPGSLATVTLLPDRNYVQQTREPIIIPRVAFNQPAQIEPIIWQQPWQQQTYYTQQQQPWQQQTYYAQQQQPSYYNRQPYFQQQQPAFYTVTSNYPRGALYLQPPQVMSNGYNNIAQPAQALPLPVASDDNNFFYNNNNNNNDVQWLQRSTPAFQFGPLRFLNNFGN